VVYIEYIRLMYPIGYIHARNKLECMGLITTEFRITTIMLNGRKISGKLQF